MNKSKIGTPQIDMNVLLANMVDRRRQGLYDRVRLKAGETMPASADAVLYSGWWIRSARWAR